MGEATERLAERLGPGIGGLLNATFGNAAELIIALFALFRGLDEVVKASHHRQHHRQPAAGPGGEPRWPAGSSTRSRGSTGRPPASAATLMVLAAIGMLIPALFHRLVGPDETRRRTSSTS